MVNRIRFFLRNIGTNKTNKGASSRSNNDERIEVVCENKDKNESDRAEKLVRLRRTFTRGKGEAQEMLSGLDEITTSIAKNVQRQESRRDYQCQHMMPNLHGIICYSFPTESMQKSLSSKEAVTITRLMASTTESSAMSSSATLASSSYVRQKMSMGEPAYHKLRWDLILSKLPKYIQETTKVAVQSPDVMVPQMYTLMEMLKQMGSHENQAHIRNFYRAAKESTTTTQISVWEVGTEQITIFRKSRRALLDCWRFALQQLCRYTADNAMDAQSDLEAYQEMIGFLMERVEFNMDLCSADTVFGESFSNMSRSIHQSQKLERKYHISSMSCWKGELKSTTTFQGVSLKSLLRLYDVSMAAKNRMLHKYVTISKKADYINDPLLNDCGRQYDLHGYRCLLVATFRYACDKAQAGALKKQDGRRRMSAHESQFFAKTLAVTYVQVPIVQDLITKHVSRAADQSVPGVTDRELGKKSSSSTTTSQASSLRKAEESRSILHDKHIEPFLPDSQNSMHDRLSLEINSFPAYKLKGSLRRFASVTQEMMREIESMPKLGETEKVEADIYDSTPLNATKNSKMTDVLPYLRKRKTIEPYLAPFSDAEIFMFDPTNTSMAPEWIDKIIDDGECFAWFITSYLEYIAPVTKDVSSIPWLELPGFTTLQKAALLIVQKAAWEQYKLSKQQSEDYQAAPSTNEASTEQFVITRRGISTVFDEVSRWLRINRDLLDPFVLSLLECTNAHNLRSVNACFTNMENWFSAAAVPRECLPHPITTSLWQLPPSFKGQKLVDALKLLCCSDSFEILKRIILFLYRRMDYFEGLLRQQILKILVQRHTSLFLHWNNEVRRYYHHVLVFKLARVSRIELGSLTDYLLVRNVLSAKAENSVTDACRQRCGADYASDSDGNKSSLFDDHFRRHFGQIPLTINKADKDYLCSSASGSPSEKALLSDDDQHDYRLVRAERAYWRAFDACIASICCMERQLARERNQQFQHERIAARNRFMAFRKLTWEKPILASTSERLSMAPIGRNLARDKERLSRDMLRKPPYYLRYLLEGDLRCLQDLETLAAHFKYPAKLQVYAPAALEEYSDLLSSYFRELHRDAVVDAPPLDLGD